MSYKTGNNNAAPKRPPGEQSLETLIEEYKDVKFLNAGMAQSQDETYVSAEVYLSGDLETKLNHAQAAQKALAAYGDKSLDVNVTRAYQNFGHNPNQLIQ